jgi:hypothetical protein
MAELFVSPVSLMLLKVGLQSVLNLPDLVLFSVNSDSLHHFNTLACVGQKYSDWG